MTTTRQRVLLVTEGTYPFHWGGLSTWCHSLIRELPEVDFSLIAVAASANERVRFEMPGNVVDFRPTPLWGVRNAWELDRARPLPDVRARRRRTTAGAISRYFLPPFKIFFQQLFESEADTDALIRAAHEMYSFFVDYDFDRTFRSEAVWRATVEQAHAVFPSLGRQHGIDRVEPSVGEISTAMHWIYHWFFPLAKKLPEVDVAHATMGGICTLVCAIAQAEFGCGFLLSEHGIYLREAYLAEHGSRGSLFLKLFKLGFARRMTELGYALAELVAPCCDYNQRWERRIGVPPERIRTAYYGIDADALKPAIRKRESEAAPVVAWAGRIDPLKDVETLLRAAAVVRAVRPEIRFRLYGNAPPGNEEYLDRCLALHRHLRLGETVTFEGYAASTVEAFAEADLVVLSSISEGFPYSTLEAMLSGKPVVATSVGGIREQVAPSCGRIVRPRDPQALGHAVLEVLDDMDAYEALARAARERAASLFTLDRFRTMHRDLYDEARSLAAESAHRRFAGRTEVLAGPRRIGSFAPGTDVIEARNELRVAAGGS